MLRFQKKKQKKIRYWINPIWNGNDRLTYSPTNNHIHLHPANDTDPNQQWKIILNTPSMGFALYNVGGKCKVRYTPYPSASVGQMVHGEPGNWWPERETATKEDLYDLNGLDFRPNWRDGKNAIVMRVSNDKKFHLETEGDISPSGAALVMSEWHNG
ncbi:hypothetical protein HDV00_003154 [Rhizophlyctis rosea]|nr:hypothetical protein HDV00_003154 [Rhizophlyctis rosea]